MLQVEKVNTFYGDLQALREVSLAAHPGEIVAVVGSNGAGKSSLLKTIAGLIAPRGGTISFAGQRIDGLPAHRVCSAGIVLVPEGRGIFPMMTVLENLEMGAFTRRRDVKKRLDEVLQVFPVLAERRHQLAGTLSGGEQQMLAIGRGLMSSPRLMLLDEPSLGLAPRIVQQVFEVVTRIRSYEGVTIVLADQNVQHALTRADRAYVIESGEVVMEGDGRTLLQSEHIKTAYLGM